MFFKAVMTILISSVFILSQAEASRRSSSQPNNWVPYPWATALPFSWTTAQGVWSVGSGEYASYFYIKVSRDNGTGAKFLSIVEKDGQTCENVATGFGKEDRTNQVSAIMKDIKLGDSYSMMLRQFNPNELPTNQSLQPVKGKVMVMTIRMANARKDYNYPMTKISERTEYRCSPKK